MGSVFFVRHASWVVASIPKRRPMLLHRLQRLSIGFIAIANSIGFSGTAFAFLATAFDHPDPAWGTAEPTCLVQADSCPREVSVYVEKREGWSKTFDVHPWRIFVCRLPSATELVVLRTWHRNDSLVSPVRFDNETRRFRSLCYGTQFDLSGVVHDEQMRQFSDDLMRVDWSHARSGIQISTRDLAPLATSGW